MSPLDAELILAALTKHFDDFNARWDRRFSETQAARETSQVVSVPTQAAAVEAESYHEAVLAPDAAFDYEFHCTGGEAASTDKPNPGPVPVQAMFDAESPCRPALDDIVELDRLSLLPDVLLRNIVSRLAVKDAARTAVLSRRWRPLWRAAPTVSLVRSEPTLPMLFPKHEICDIDGLCVDAAADEFSRLTSQEGKLIIECEKVQIEAQPFFLVMQFEQNAIRFAISPTDRRRAQGPRRRRRPPRLRVRGRRPRLRARTLLFQPGAIRHLVRAPPRRRRGRARGTLHNARGRPIVANCSDSRDVLCRGFAGMLPVPLYYASVTPGSTPASAAGSNANSAARKASCPADAAIFDKLVFLSIAHEFLEPLSSYVLHLDLAVDALPTPDVTKELASPGARQVFEVMSLHADLFCYICIGFELLSHMSMGVNLHQLWPLSHVQAKIGCASADVRPLPWPSFTLGDCCCMSQAVCWKPPWLLGLVEQGTAMLCAVRGHHEEQGEFDDSDIWEGLLILKQGGGSANSASLRVSRLDSMAPAQATNSAWLDDMIGTAIVGFLQNNNSSVSCQVEAYVAISTDKVFWQQRLSFRCSPFPFALAFASLNSVGWQMLVRRRCWSLPTTQGWIDNNSLWMELGVGQLMCIEWSYKFSSSCSILLVASFLVVRLQWQPEDQPRPPPWPRFHREQDVQRFSPAKTFATGARLHWIVLGVPAS